MKPLMPSACKPRTTLATPTNLNSLLTIIWTFVLITPNLTSGLVLVPPCASTCYLNAFDSEASLCDALNTSCLCDILESTDYLTCIEDDCDTASLQQAVEYAEQYCGAGYSTLLAGAAQATTSTTQDVLGGVTPTAAATSFATAIDTPAEPTATAEATSTSSAAAAVATNTDDSFDIPTNTLATVAQSPTITPFAPTPTTVIIQSDSSDYGHSGGLSRRKRAGIGAGAGVGGAALLCIVGALAWKLGQRRKNEEEEKRVAAGRAMATAAAGNGNNNDNNGGGVSGGVNYVPSGEEAAWTKIEANATETELDGGHKEGANVNVHETML